MVIYNIECAINSYGILVVQASVCCTRHSLPQLPHKVIKTKCGHFEESFRPLVCCTLGAYIVQVVWWSVMVDLTMALKSSCCRPGRALVHQPIPGEMQVVPDEGPDEEDWTDMNRSKKHSYFQTCDKLAHLETRGAHVSGLWPPGPRWGREKEGKGRRNSFARGITSRTGCELGVRLWACLALPNYSLGIRSFKVGFLAMNFRSYGLESESLKGKDSLIWCFSHVRKWSPWRYQAASVWVSWLRRNRSLCL